jgi:NADH:ubiquinone reductase (non-electrogenic)
MQNPATGDIAVPYGMAVWSTGIGTRPFVVDFMKQIGQVDKNYLIMCPSLCSSSKIIIPLDIQANRRVLATDEWLRVRECGDVYAVGDCATINQRRVMVCNKYSSFYVL